MMPSMDNWDTQLDPKLTGAIQQAYQVVPQLNFVDKQLVKQVDVNLSDQSHQMDS